MEIFKHRKFEAGAAILIVAFLGAGLHHVEEESKKPHVLARGPYELTIIAACATSQIPFGELSAESRSVGDSYILRSGVSLHSAAAGVNQRRVDEAAFAIGAKGGGTLALGGGWQPDGLPGVYTFRATAEAVFIDGEKAEITHGSKGNVTFRPLERIEGTLYCPGQTLADFPGWIGREFKKLLPEQLRSAS